MSRMRLLALAGLAAALAAMAVAALIASADRPGEASTISREGRGWLAARRYLEERGCRVRLVDRSLEEAVPGDDGVLVLAFPWQTAFAGGVHAAVDRQLQAGGHVVFAYSGRRNAPSESFVAVALGLDWVEVGEKPPLWPWQWRRHAAEEWTLSAEPAGDGGRPARIGAPRRVPAAPPGALVLARDERQRPVAFSYARARGRVVAVPSEAFSNARLREPGNADLLERLRQDLGTAWAFDEYHHGLRATAPVAATAAQHVLLLYVGQIAFVYALVALAAGRRFGPAWRDPAPASGTVASFLLGLGALHDRLGHHRAAARALKARARELDGRIVLPVAREGGDFLELARDVGLAQVGRRKTG